jgi:hypothetical protein
MIASTDALFAVSTFYLIDLRPSPKCHALLDSHHERTVRNQSSSVAASVAAEVA